MTFFTPHRRFYAKINWIFAKPARRDPIYRMIYYRLYHEPNNLTLKIVNFCATKHLVMSFAYDMKQKFFSRNINL